MKIVTRKSSGEIDCVWHDRLGARVPNRMLCYLTATVCLEGGRYSSVSLKIHGVFFLRCIFLKNLQIYKEGKKGDFRILFYYYLKFSPLERKRRRIFFFFPVIPA